MMHRTVRWEEMFKDELDETISAHPVCYFAYGLSEPHGVQNAVGLDGLKAQALVEMAAREHGGVVAPPTWWHVHETPLGQAWLAQQQAPMPRLTDVPADLFLRQLLYQLRAAELAGFRVALLVTGHYGGIEVDMRMVTQIYSQHRPLRALAVADWELIRYKDYHGDHAGICETSQLWALRPELVDLTRMPKEPIDGVLFASHEEARRSSRREGEAIVRSQVASLRQLAELLFEEVKDYPPADWISFAEVEAIWAQIAALHDRWISTHPVDGFWEYLEERRMQAYPLPW
jgi:creatinine amidohydrolase